MKMATKAIKHIGIKEFTRICDNYSVGNHEKHFNNLGVTDIWTDRVNNTIVYDFKDNSAVIIPFIGNYRIIRSIKS